MHAFWRSGFSGTTTRDLEAALDINASSLYNAFGSKQELLAEVIERYRRGVDADVLAPLQAPAAGLAAIDEFLRSLERWITGDGRCGCLVARLVAEGGAYGEPVDTLISGYRRDLRAALRGALRRAAEVGEIPPQTVDRRLEVLTGMVLGLNLAAQGSAGATAVRRLARADREEIASWAAGGVSPSAI
jgi:AcrR family transcriptional regulator